MTKMLAMALLLHGGLLVGMGGEAAWVDGSGGGAWTPVTLAEGFLAALGAGSAVSLLTYTLWARGLVNGGDRWNSQEHFLTTILYSPALWRVNSIPDSHSEFRILRTQRIIPSRGAFFGRSLLISDWHSGLHLKWNPPT